MQYDGHYARPKGSQMTQAETKCPHRRTRLIAKDNDAQYVECLDCGEILEAGEIKPVPTQSFDESLSDA